MKKNFILGLAAISMLSFASCEKEPTTEQKPGGGVVEGIPTTATISLTNAPETMATEAGSAEESKVTDATLYVFNNADVLESIVAFTDMTAKKVTFQTTTGMKRLFVCVNMNDQLPAGTFQTVTSAATPAQVTTLAQFKKKEMSIANIAAISTNNKFWMTNLEKQPAQVQVTDQSASNNFTVSVGRAAAKVSLSIGTGVAGNGGRLEDLKFTPKNNPNKMYLMPVYDGTNYTGMQLLTPYYAASASGTYISGTKTNVPGSTYMVENSNEEIKAGKVTYLEVEGTWTPALDKTRKADGSPATTALAKGSDFWRIAVYDKDPTQTGAIITGYKDEYCYAAQPQAGLIGTNQAAIKYTGGKSYYAIHIQDKNAGSDQQLPLRYTIKRNAFFKVVISSISGPGSSTQQGVIPDPEKPVETVVNMSVTIQVAPWTVADLSAGI